MKSFGSRVLLKTLCATMVVAAGMTAMVSASYAQETIRYNMAWLPQGSTAGVPIAVDQGWFKDEGLDVEVMRGYGGSRTANELDQGQFDVGYVDPISLILTRKNGGKIRLIGAINTVWPAGVCFAKSRHDPKGLDDLEGLTMGGGSASPVQNLVPAWLEMNGKPRDFIKLVRLDPAVVDASFVEGKTDLTDCWRGSNRPVIVKQAEAAGLQIGAMEYKDFGLNAYGNGFATTEDMIQNKPDVLRKFLKVAYRGYQFMRESPEEAADIMLRLYPTIDRTVILNQIKEINELTVDAESPNETVGFLRDDRMNGTLELIDKAYDLQGSIQASDLYTNDLLQ